MRDWLHRRRWLGGLLIVVLLFGQTAAVVYACERDLVTLTARADDTVASHGDRCAEHMRSADPAADQPLLCKAHCEADEQSVNTTCAAPTLPPGDALAVVLWRLPDGVDAAPSVGSWPDAQAAGPPVGFPPLYLSLLVLRN